MSHPHFNRSHALSRSRFLSDLVNQLTPSFRNGGQRLVRAFPDLQRTLNEAVKQAAGAWFNEQHDDLLRSSWLNCSPVDEILGADLMAKCIGFLGPKNGYLTVPIPPEAEYLSSCFFVSRQWYEVARRTRYKYVQSRGIDFENLLVLPRNTFGRVWCKLQIETLIIRNIKPQIRYNLFEELKAACVNASIHGHILRIRNVFAYHSTVLASIDPREEIFSELEHVYCQGRETIEETHRFLSLLPLGHKLDTFQVCTKPIKDEKSAKLLAELPHLLPPSIVHFFFPVGLPTHISSHVISSLSNLETLRFWKRGLMRTLLDERCLHRLSTLTKLREVEIPLDSSVRDVYAFKLLRDLMRNNSGLERVEMYFDSREKDLDEKYQLLKEAIGQDELSRWYVTAGICQGSMRFCLDVRKEAPGVA